MSVLINSYKGHNHIIVPMGYNMVKKQRYLHNNSHDIFTQFEIHTQAKEFVSAIIIIPTPRYIESYKSYVMDEMPPGNRVNPHFYDGSPSLIKELLRFQEFMKTRGYYASRYSVHYIGINLWALCDFSGFGIIQKDRVYFPRMKNSLSFEDADKFFGLQHMRKIEASV